MRHEGDHQTLTIGTMQLVDTIQPGGAKVNISFFLDKWAPYSDSLKPLLLMCCVACGKGGGGAHEGMHFSQSKNSSLFNF